MAAVQDYRELDDGELTICAQQGDRQAFGELVTRHHSKIIGMLYHMCGDARLAEDAAQEAFIRVWQNLNRYKAGHAFRSWLYRIAANAALDSLRREHTPAMLDETLTADPQAGPEVTVEARQKAGAVRRAIGQLSPPLRLVLVLREYQELSYQEIAEALDIPTGTVMSRLASARGQLRHELSDLLEEV